jgi:DNA repair protein RadC
MFEIIRCYYPKLGNEFRTCDIIESGLKIIGITLTDDIIIGDNRHYSIKESGSI